MKKGTLLFSHVNLHPNEIHKFRGYIGTVFKDHDLVHNHDFDTGKSIYRYPLIQFKLIKGHPAIVAFSEPAIRIFTEIFLKLDHVDIGGKTIPIHEKDFNLEEVEFGYSDSIVSYRFITPWIALNQTNFKKYVESADKTSQRQMLNRAFIGNILSMAKGLGTWLTPEQKISADLNVRRTTVQLKGKSFIGFTGTAKTSFNIPDYAALGKSISRGYGALQRL